MAYSPPLTEIGAGVLMPPTVMAVDVRTMPSGAPVIGVKLNGFGVVSVAVVTMNAAVTPPMLRVALAEKPGWGERTLTDTWSPLITLAASERNAPPLI